MHVSKVSKIRMCDIAMDGLVFVVIICVLYHPSHKSTPLIGKLFQQIAPELRTATISAV